MGIESDTAFDDLDGVVRDCAADLFGRLATAIAPEPFATQTDTQRRGTPREIVSFIDFGGPTLRATLAFRVSLSVAKAAFPLRRKDASDGELLDWAGEMANQVAGRITNKLSSRGLTLQMGLPGTVLAPAIELFCESGASKRPSVVFDAFGVRVYLSVAGTAANAESPIRDDEAAHSANEGDVLLF